MKPLLAREAMDAIVHGTHGSPYEVLGMNETGPSMPGVVVRSFQPYARKVEIINSDSGEALELARIHDQGLFERVLPDRAKFRYRLRMTGFDDHQWELEDPYRFPLQITDFDLYLLGEGTHYRTYTKMGAHVMTIDGVQGVHFAVWAPNAMRVSVIGWFNRWDGRHHPMQHRGGSGLWEIFIPHLQPGDLYKFEIKGRHNFLGQKADPYAFFSELRPKSASVVWDLNRYQWRDQDWMAQRRETRWHDKPISVYEVHPSSWRRVPEDFNRWLTYRELADQLVPYVKEL